jgi:type I restriction enzyme M protein
VPNDFKSLGIDYSNKRSKSWTSVSSPSNRYFVPRYLALKTRLKDLDFGIAGDSQRHSLGELVSSGLLTVAKGHEVGSEAYGTGEVPFVRTSDITNFEIRTDTTNGVSDDIYQEFSRLQNLQTGDVLLVVDGRYRIGAAAILSDRNSRIVVQSHIRILQSTDHDKLDPYALLYSLTLSAVREQMRDLVFIQSTLGTVAPKLQELVIPVISRSDRAFAHVENFRATLSERDRLLQILSTESSTEVEL